MFFNGYQMTYLLHNEKISQMIFNASQRTVKLNLALQVLKMMLKELKIMMMEMKYQIHVDKYVACGE